MTKALWGAWMTLAIGGGCAVSEQPFGARRDPVLGAEPGEVALAPGEAVVTIDGEVHRMAAMLPWPSVTEFLSLWEGDQCHPVEPPFDWFTVDREALSAAYDNELPPLPHSIEFEPYDDVAMVQWVLSNTSTPARVRTDPVGRVRSTLHEVTRAALPDPWTGEIREVVESMRGSFELVDLEGRHIVAEYDALNCMAAGCDNCQGLSSSLNGWDPIEAD